MKPVQKEDTGPTLIGIIISALCMATIGCLLGFAFLSAFPVKAIATAKDLEGILEERAGLAARPGQAYYFEAPIARSRNWELQRQALLSGTAPSAEFQFEDLNAWASRYFRPASAPVNEEEPNVLLLPGTPKFGTDGTGDIYCVLPINATVFGYSKDYTVYAVGEFKPESKAFEVKSMYVNGAAFPPVPGIAHMVFNSFLEAFAQSDEYQTLAEAWESVDAVEVTANSIRLRM